MTRRIMPSQEFLREALDYDPETGEVTWRTRPLAHFASHGAMKRWNTLYAGKTASSSVHKYGHRQVCLMDQNWLAHRLIWKWMTGDDPVEIDHREGLSNRWGNLRVGGYPGNARNRKVMITNKVGLKGVYLPKGSPRFGARIRVKGTLIHLGTFDTKEEAHAAYCVAARKHFGEFWNAG